MLILCYHALEDDEETPWRLKADSFRLHLDSLKLSGYRFGIVPTHSFQCDEKIAVITFDDGCLSCFTKAAPILEEYGIPATFYITSGFIDRTAKPSRPAELMQWGQVCRLKKRFQLGAHSISHAVFDELPFPDRLREMSISKRAIEHRTGGSVVHWATPHGYWDDDLKSDAISLGFKSFVTTEPAINRFVDPMRLKRWEVHSPCSRDDFDEQLAKLESEA